MRPRIALAAAVACSAAAPVVTGTVPDDGGIPYAIAAAVAVAALGAPWRSRARVWANRAALVIVSSALSLAAIDTAARIVMRFWLEPGPVEIYGDPYPRMPLIGRYAANVRYHARTFGDLARPWDLRADREYRDLVWITDGAGFPNDPATVDPAQPLDLILLGDSFGEGGDTSYERSWGALFRSRYGLRVYNLSIAAASPWHEYVTLASEIGGLRTRPGTLVVWALFTGNDLDGGIYHSTLDLAQLPWQGPLGEWRTKFQRFRDRSPVRRAQSLLRERAHMADVVWRRPFLDGGAVLFFRPHVSRARATLDMVEHHPDFPALQATFAATAKLARERGLRLAVVLIPSKEEVYAWVVENGPAWSTTGEPSALSIAVARMAAAHGVDFFDLKPPFVTESRRAWEQAGGLLWWRDDTHWNERGHELAARAVYERFVAPRPSR